MTTFWKLTLKNVIVVENQIINFHLKHYLPTQLWPNGKEINKAKLDTLNL